MALQLKLTNTNTVNTEGTRVYLRDDTGLYSLTNLGGYGLPNTERNAIALLLLATSKGSRGDVLVGTEPYNPLTTGIFNVIVDKDGWYVFQLVALPLYDTSLLSTYDAGDILYDPISGNINKVIQTIVPAVIVPVPVVVAPSTPGPTPIIVPSTTTTTTTTPTTTTSTVTPTVVATPSLPTTLNTIIVIAVKDLVGSSYILATTDTLFIANNSKTKLRINTIISNLISNKADFTDKKLIRQKDNYNALRAVLQGAIYEFCRGNKYVAQTDIEFLNNNNYVLD